LGRNRYPTKKAETKARPAQDFWLPEKRLPQATEVTATISLPAIVVKKGGDFPAFWQQDTSFLAVMEELSDRVRTKNKGAF